MTNIHIAQDYIIKENEFKEFLSQFEKGESFDNFSLCKKLREMWIKSITDGNNNSKYSMVLPLPYRTGTVLTKVPRRGGVYAIFARHPKMASVKCFYVGISQTDVKTRLRVHLREDIIKNYRGQFDWLKECIDIYLCYAIVDAVSGLEEGRQQQLELLEHYLTVSLKPWFLLLAARSARTSLGMEVSEK